MLACVHGRWAWSQEVGGVPSAGPVFENMFAGTRVHKYEGSQVQVWWMVSCLLAVACCHYYTQSQTRTLIWGSMLPSFASTAVT